MAGRPPVIAGEILKKLEEVFSLGGTDKEACFYAGISIQTLYNYQIAHPGYVERKEALKEEPILLARRTVVKALKINPQSAAWYLERKAKKEFASRQEHTGADGEPLFDDETKTKAKRTIGAFLDRGHSRKGG